MLELISVEENLLNMFRSNLASFRTELERSPRLSIREGKHAHFESAICLNHISAMRKECFETLQSHEFRDFYINEYGMDLCVADDASWSAVYHVCVFTNDTRRLGESIMTVGAATLIGPHRTSKICAAVDRLFSSASFFFFYPPPSPPSCPFAFSVGEGAGLRGVRLL